MIPTDTTPVTVPSWVARLALNVISSDPRRHPYGHHQWDRINAGLELRNALADVSPRPQAE